MIKEAYCSFEVSKLLREKGFNEPCGGFYTNTSVLSYTLSNAINSKWNEDKSTMGYISAPTHQMALRWLREEKSTSIIIRFDVTERGYCPYVYQLDYDMDWVVKWRINIPMKYEEAVETALKYCLENLI